MIQMPRRSVTRFFIPLIDVMTLLFCIFLLMPIFDRAAQEKEQSAGAESDRFRLDLDRDRLVRRLREAERKVKTLQNQDPSVAKLREELERLKKERGKPLQERYAIFVLGIDAGNGQLFYYEPGDANRKRTVATKEDAAKLIARQRKDAGRREPFFLFQIPRKKSAFPQVKQRKQYEAWFQDVPHGFDIPSSRT
jgi:hypothetical protein